MKTDFLSLHGFSPEVRHLGFEQRVRLVRIETFFGHAAGNMAGIAIATLLFAYILFTAGVATPVWFGWASFVLAVTAALAVFDHRIKQRGLTQENAPGFLRQRVIFGVVVGLSCASGALLVPLEASMFAHACAVMLCITIMTVLTLAYAVVPAYYLALSVGAMLPPGGALSGAWRHDRRLIISGLVGCLLDFDRRCPAQGAGQHPLDDSGHRSQHAPERRNARAPAHRYGAARE